MSAADVAIIAVAALFLVGVMVGIAVVYVLSARTSPDGLQPRARQLRIPAHRGRPARPERTDQ
jgi:hypothetical protein